MSRRARGRKVDGWVIVDKPLGVTSTQVVAKVRWAFDAAKAGHAGTLDPLATGILPVALGEATKTVPYVQDGVKRYSVDVRWGVETSTDDREGEAVAQSDQRPEKDDILAVLPGFTGRIMQVPPAFSAIKVDGQRAYALARRGDAVSLEPRPVFVYDIRLIGQADRDHARFEITCGKGTYIRALARDIARKLGTCGHAASLRRLAVGPFGEDRAVPWAELEASDKGAASPAALLPVETALDDIPALALTDQEVARLRHGQPVALIRRSDVERLQQAGLDAGAGGVTALATHGGRAVALVAVDGVHLRPMRLLHL